MQSWPASCMWWRKLEYHLRPPLNPNHWHLSHMPWLLSGFCRRKPNTLRIITCFKIMINPCLYISFAYFISFSLSPWFVHFVNILQLFSCITLYGILFLLCYARSLSLSLSLTHTHTIECWKIYNDIVFLSILFKFPSWKTVNSLPVPLTLIFAYLCLFD